MGLRQILAAGTRKKLRWAVIRPKDQSLVAGALERLKETLDTESFQNTMHGTLAHGGIFVGFLKPGSKRLFNGDGTPGRFTLQPGDILDEIEDFKKACQMGGYQATGQRIDPDGTVHESPVTSH